MANKNFPGPNINRLIENDPQIVKIDMDYMGWGTRTSMMGEVGRGRATGKNSHPGDPKAPEATIKHVGSK